MDKNCPSQQIVNGKPIYFYSIDSAIKTNIFDKYMSQINQDRLTENEKTKFIYNAIEDGWTVKKVTKRNNNNNQMDVNNQIYEFIKPKKMLDDNDYSLKKYLELFLKDTK